MTLAAALLVAVGVRPALAQPKVEVSGILGWTFSDGVSGNAVTAGDGNVYNRLDPKDSGSIGGEIEFVYLTGRFRACQLCCSCGTSPVRAESA